MSRRIALEEAATADEVKQAILTMTPQEKTLLRCYAKLLARKLDGDHESLVNETLLSIMNPEKKRRWRKDKVPFWHFLKKAMQSVASNLYREKNLDKRGIKELQLQVQSQEISDSHVYEELLKNDLLTVIFDHFKGDELVKKLIDGIVSGKKPREIRKETGMTTKEHDAACGRLERASSMLFEKGLK